METPTQPPIKLHCCHGTPPPPQIVDGWKKFLEFSKTANSRIWSLLMPALMDPHNPASNKLVVSFCQENGVGQDDLLAAVRSCVFLLSRAAALNLGLDLLDQDFATLSPPDSKAHEVLLSRYEGLKSELRKLIITESLADHGKVLVGLDWRVDQVNASHRGMNLNTPVVMMTLRYRDGNQFERTTLQLTPETLNELKLFCERFTAANP